MTDTAVNSCVKNKFIYIEGRDSSVGKVTCYGLDGPGIESRWGRDFPHPSRPALGPNQPPLQTDTGSLPGVKRPGRDVRPPSSTTEIKKRLDLYLCSPSVPSWYVIERKLTSLYIYMYVYMGARDGVVVKALRYKPAGRGFVSR